MKDLIGIWKSFYCYIISTAFVVLLITLRYFHKFDINVICVNALYKDMLTAIITFLSIVISVFGFLIPSLIAVKNDTMVKYFLKHADVNVFSNKIKNVVLSGIVEILITSVLFMYDIFNSPMLYILFYAWIWVLLYFSCSAYRFISIMVGLLIGNNQAPESIVKNKMADFEISELNKRLKEDK